MALSIASSLGTTVSEARHSEKMDYRNDAFSFWKLAENYRVALTQAAEASEPLMRRYMFEEYKAPSAQAPSSTLTNYYRIKKFIPPQVRHWMNYVAVRARLRDVFPNWPCETALIDLCHQWLRAAADVIGQQEPWHIAFWPNGKRCCVALTHDVESPMGFARMERMADLEELY